MKTMKYRSVYSTLCVAALSVFLFTSCEKESDSVGGVADRLEKFKRLEFSGSGSGATGSTTSSSGSGTFIGGGGSNLSYIPPSDGGSAAQFAPTVSGGGEFTDPMSTGPSFAVANSFSAGGGTFSLGRKSYELDFGFCASSDIFGDLSGPSANEGDLEMFIGVAGDFDFTMAGDDEPDDLGIELILYVFSYNGGSRIGDFDVFEGNGDPSNSAFIIAVTFVPGADEDATLYYGKSGSVSFSGGSVALSSVKMAKVEENDLQENILTSTIVNAGGFLECGSIVFDDDQGEQ